MRGKKILPELFQKYKNPLITSRQPVLINKHLYLTEWGAHMKNKFISNFIKFLTAITIAILMLALYLNVSTLLSTEKIKHGESVTSGYFCAIIGSGSMAPTISVNDLLIIKNDTFYEENDIITYVLPKGSLLTHRVKKVSENGYITQGDANNIPDKEISGQEILGKVIFALPGIGGLIDGIISPVGIILLSCICLLWGLIQKAWRDNDEYFDISED